ncbi:hypothetical protein [uncultured Pseudomonas sp.]|uniref:hypothetical protein n=1 Tax=uncultured Pseudomonas sp. TaxID=114707 RepID=UPI0025989BF7|nr:hypothetical protein [uncultured Pseudomonas sp.]
MTVNTISSIAEFDTNGVTTNFPFYFKFLANEDLVVTYVDPQGVSSTLTLGTHYTVNGAGNDQGGSIITISALAGPGQLIASREMDAFQLTSLRNQGKFLAETHEDVFDKLTMLIQQGFAKIGRALLRPFGKNYYDAEGRQIKNLGDPSLAQDAATKSFVQQEIADLLQIGSGSANNAANVLYVPNGPGQIPRPVQVRLRDSFSVRDYIESPIDGTTSNQAGIVSAVAAALAAGADLYWPAGTYVSTESIPGFHDVKHIGRGVIKRGAYTFKITNRAQANSIYVATTGSDTNDGISPSEPMLTPQAAADNLAKWGDFLEGAWTIQLAAGTYPPVFFPVGIQSRNFIGLSGPSVGHPNVPTAIIDGAGAANGSCIVCSEGVRLAVRNVKVQNVTGTLSIGISATKACDIYLDNAHTQDCYSGVQATYNSRLRVKGGVFSDGAIGFGVGTSCGYSIGYAAGGTRAGGPIIKNMSVVGVKISELSTGHLDYSTVDNCLVGVELTQWCRMNNIGNEIKNCTKAGLRATASIFTQAGDVYSNNGTNWLFDSYSWLATIGTDSQGALRVGRVKNQITHTGTTSKTILATPFKLPASYFTDDSKQLRINIRGVLNATAGVVTVGVDFGTIVMQGVASAGAVTGALFEAEFILDAKTSATQRTYARLIQNTTIVRQQANDRAFNAAVAAIAVNIVGTLSSASDSLVIDSVDVELVG